MEDRNCSNSTTVTFSCLEYSVSYIKFKAYPVSYQTSTPLDPIRGDKLDQIISGESYVRTVRSSVMYAH